MAVGEDLVGRPESSSEPEIAVDAENGKKQRVTKEHVYIPSTTYVVGSFDRIGPVFCKSERKRRLSSGPRGEQCGTLLV